MTPAEFLHKYHDYKTDDLEAARAERAAAAAVLQGDCAVLVDFGALGYGLMLLTAVMFLGDLGIKIDATGGYEVRLV